MFFTLAYILVGCGVFLSMLEFNQFDHDMLEKIHFRIHKRSLVLVLYFVSLENSVLLDRKHCLQVAFFPSMISSTNVYWD